MLPIDPVFFSIGPIQIRYYGLVYAAAFLILYSILQKKRHELKLTSENVDGLILSLFFGLLLGGRIGHFVFSDPSVLLTPWKLLYIWQGGMSFFGAVVGLSVGGYLFSRKKKTDWWKIADITALVGSGALIFGRITNFINQELVGRVTDVSWCVEFVTAEGCRHPYQLYAALSHAILFAYLFYNRKQFTAKNAGILLSIFLVGYSGFRFFTDFFRDDPLYFGLTIWQYVSLVTISIGLYLYNKRGKKYVSKTTQ